MSTQIQETLRALSAAAAAAPAPAVTADDSWGDLLEMDEESDITAAAAAPAATPQVSDDAAHPLALSADDSYSAACDLCGDLVSVDDVITDCHQRTVCHSCAQDLGLL